MLCIVLSEDGIEQTKPVQKHVHGVSGSIRSQNN